MEDAAAVGDKTKPSIFVNQESGCTPALGHELFIARELFQLSSDDSLNQGNVSLLQRVDHLDNILSTMEDKAPTEPSGNLFTSPQASRRISSTPSSLEKRCKSTESVLEEVEEKGTLIERVSELEKRLMKLQRMITTKSSDNVAYVDLVEVTTLDHLIPPHDEAISHHHEHDHDQSLQDLVDVEKHEVTTVSNAPLESDHHNEPFIYSEKIDISPRKRESPLHMEGHQGMVSSEGTGSVEEEDPRARQQKFKKKSQKIKRWLSKRLHIGSSTQQGKCSCSTGRCWSSHTNPQSCWNIKRGDLHTSSTYTHYVHKSIDEDSP